MSIRLKKMSIGSVSNGPKEHYASDYFEQLYDWAVELIPREKPMSMTSLRRRYA